MPTRPWTLYHRLAAKRWAGILILFLAPPSFADAEHLRPMTSRSGLEEALHAASAGLEEATWFDPRESVVGVTNIQVAFHDEKITWNPQRYGPVTAQLVYHHKRIPFGPTMAEFPTVQVIVDKNWRQTHSDQWKDLTQRWFQRLDKAGDVIPAEGKRVHERTKAELLAETGVFGQLLIGRYRFPDGRVFILIEEIQPTSWYRSLTESQRKNLDPWREQAVAAVSQWSFGAGYPVYGMPSAALIARYRDFFRIDEYNGRKNAEEPYAGWQPVVMDIRFRPVHDPRHGRNITLYSHPNNAEIQREWARQAAGHMLPNEGGKGWEWARKADGLYGPEEGVREVLREFQAGPKPIPRWPFYGTLVYDPSQRGGIFLVGESAEARSALAASLAQFGGGRFLGEGHLAGFVSPDGVLILGRDPNQAALTLTSPLVGPEVFSPLDRFVPVRKIFVLAPQGTEAPDSLQVAAKPYAEMPELKQSVAALAPERIAVPADADLEWYRTQAVPKMAGLEEGAQLPPMTVPEVIAYLSSKPLLSSILRQVSETTLNLRSLRPGAKSLHVGSDVSLFPVAEALMGLDVLVIDKREGSAIRVTEMLEEYGLGEEIKRRGGAFRYEVGDVLNLNLLGQDPYDYVTAMDLVDPSLGPFPTEFLTAAGRRLAELTKRDGGQALIGGGGTYSDIKLPLLHGQGAELQNEQGQPAFPRAELPDYFEVALRTQKVPSWKAQLVSKRLETEASGGLFDTDFPVVLFTLSEAGESGLEEQAVRLEEVDLAAAVRQSIASLPAQGWIVEQLPAEPVPVAVSAASGQTPAGLQALLAQVLSRFASVPGSTRTTVTLENRNVLHELDQNKPLEEDEDFVWLVLRSEDLSENGEFWRGDRISDYDPWHGVQSDAVLQDLIRRIHLAGGFVDHRLFWIPRPMHIVALAFPRNRPVVEMREWLTDPEIDGATRRYQGEGEAADGRTMHVPMAENFNVASLRNRFQEEAARLPLGFSPDLNGAEIMIVGPSRSPHEIISFLRSYPGIAAIHLVDPEPVFYDLATSPELRQFLRDHSSIQTRLYGYRGTVLELPSSLAGRIHLVFDRYVFVPGFFSEGLFRRSADQVSAVLVPGGAHVSAQEHMFPVAGYAHRPEMQTMVTDVNLHIFVKALQAGLEQISPIPQIGTPEVLLSLADVLRSNAWLAGPQLVGDKYGIPQLVRSWKVGNGVPSDLPSTRPLVISQPGLLPSSVTLAFRSRGWSVEEPVHLSGVYIERKAREWSGPLFVIVGSGLEEAVRSLQGSQVTAVILDEGMAQLLSPNRLLSYLLEVLRDLPGRFVRLDYFIRSSLEEFWAVSTQL